MFHNFYLIFPVFQLLPTFLTNWTYLRALYDFFHTDMDEKFKFYEIYYELIEVETECCI